MKPIFGMNQSSIKILIQQQTTSYFQTLSVIVDNISCTFLVTPLTTRITMHTDINRTPFILLFQNCIVYLLLSSSLGLFLFGLFFLVVLLLFTIIDFPLVVVFDFVVKSLLLVM